MLSPFSPAFLRGEPRAEAFLSGDFRHAAARAARVHQAGMRRVSALTLASLRAQAARFKTSPAREAHLTALASPGTSVVVTGQQVGLFLGPLYAFYKAASAIVTARALAAETGTACVPVFWLQSEDHDFEEVNHCHVLTSDGQLQRLELPAEPGPPRRSMGAHLLGEGVIAQLNALESALAGPHGAEVMALFRAHYRPEATWVDAFAGVMSHVFAEHGLLVFDPRDPGVSPVTGAVHRRAFEERAAISKLLLERTAALEHAGFAAQVHVRANAPLSFFHPEGPLGPRYRMEEPKEDHAHWRLVGHPLELSETLLRDALERSPDHFSTSALLRPILQDSLFPTAAIVGGPGELNYFAQLAALYSHFSLPMPMLVPRARFRAINARTRSRLEALGLTAAEVEAPADVLLKRLRPTDGGVAAETLEQRLMRAVDPVLDTVPQASPQVADGVQRLRATLDRAAKRLAGRLERELREKDATLRQRLELVQRELFPLEEPQERVLSLPSLAAQTGLRELTSLVMSTAVPFGVDVKELNP